MTSFITGWVEDKVSGYLKTGIQAGGTLAGNAVGGVGTLIEGAGRTVGSGVSGGIGGVGGYINGYGEKVKGSMAADGPVSAGQKKTAVKPSSAVGQRPPAVQKSLPSTGGAQKALPAPSQKSMSAPKPAAQASKSYGAGIQKAQSVAGAARPGQNNKPSGLSNARPTNGVSKLPHNASKNAPSMISNPTSKTTSSGKVTISSASRPKPSGATTRSMASSAQRQTPSGSKGPERKSTAGDLLALGEDIGNIGKKK